MKFNILIFIIYLYHPKLIAQKISIDNFTNIINFHEINYSDNYKLKNNSTVLWIKINYKNDSLLIDFINLDETGLDQINKMSSHRVFKTTNLGLGKFIFIKHGKKELFKDIRGYKVKFNKYNYKKFTNIFEPLTYKYYFNFNTAEIKFLGTYQ